MWWKINFATSQKCRIFALDFKSEIVKRYTRSVQRNLRNSNEKQNLCNGLRYLAWAYCIFFFQGNSQDLFAGSGIRRHASFIINAQRGAEERKI